MATKITTLENTTKTDALLPRTVLKAVADKNGDFISEDVLASDINALKDGAITSLSNLSIDKLRIIRTTPYSGTTSSTGTVLGSATLPKGKYLAWFSGSCTMYDAYATCTDYQGYVSNISILDITTEQTITITPASNSSMTWHIYCVNFLKIE